MDIFVLDENLIPLDIVDTYESLIWADRYNECGDFEISTPINKYILDIMKQDNYLFRNDSEYVMIVEKLLITTNAENGKQLTVTGRSLESMLDRRIIWGQKTITGNLQDGIEMLLNENVINPTDENRKIANFVFEKSDDPAITKLKIEAQYTGDCLYDVIVALCKERGIGFKITLNDDKQFVFKLYAGKDRSYSQTDNNHVLFSPEFDNLISSNYVESRSSLKNVTLVGGEGEGSERKYVSVGEGVGLYRRELFTDARDITSDAGYNEETYEEITLSEEEYLELLRQRGREKLTENKEVVTFEGEAETSTMYRYGKDEDFYIGDIVQISDEYGHEAKARILEVVTSEGEEGVSVYPTFETIQEGE